MTPLFSKYIPFTLKFNRKNFILSSNDSLRKSLNVCLFVYELFEQIIKLYHFNFAAWSKVLLSEEFLVLAKVLHVIEFLYFHMFLWTFYFPPNHTEWKTRLLLFVEKLTFLWYQQ